MQSSNTIECIIYVQLHIPSDPPGVFRWGMLQQKQILIIVSSGRSMMMMIITTVITTLKDKIIKIIQLIERNVVSKVFLFPAVFQTSDPAGKINFLAIFGHCHI